VSGTIQIEGPASLPYDIDLGVFPISDWHYPSSEEIMRRMMAPPGIAPIPDNLLINGTHVGANGTGSYYRVKLKPGKRHRLRLINIAVDVGFAVSLVNHQFTVIATDFVPVNAYTTSSVFLGIGQRYDVTIDASQAVGNYWFNVTFANAGFCGRTQMRNPAAIFEYEGAPPNSLPTILGVPPNADSCEDNYNFSPVVQRSVPSSLFHVDASHNLSMDFSTLEWNGQQRVFWRINNQPMNVTWDEPTLEYIAKNNTNFPQRYNLFQVPQANQVRTLRKWLGAPYIIFTELRTNSPRQWSFWVIENASRVPVCTPVK
jgi:FtsP/CotA-like multicopper oxidase with cupredoxin domain